MSDEPRRRPARNLITVGALSLMAAFCVAGLPYYRLAVAGRLRHPWHPWLKPSGYIGQSAGILALALFLFLWLYPLRKRFRWLAFTGSIGAWLDIHILVGLGIPLLGAIHASWRFEGLIGLGYASMLVVCLSGVVGKYIYTRIPRRVNGLSLTMDEMRAERQRLLQEIISTTDADPGVVQRCLAAEPVACDGLGPTRTLARMVRDDMQRWWACRRLNRMLPRSTDRARLRRSLRLARRQMAMDQQIRMLDASNRVFRFWHVAHRPLAVSALVAVLVHVVVVVGLGSSWIW